MISEETHVWFPAGAVQLEGMLRRGSGAKGVVVCHPHPLYGGDMHNPVVTTAAAAFAGAEFSSLRFNFRGTGASEGIYGGGNAEQEDVLGAASFLQQEAGADEVWLAGYSFGAFVVAHVPEGELPPGQRVLIAPPVQVMDFSSVGRIEGLRLVVVGSRDEIAPPGAIEPVLPTWNKGASLEVVQGADHFYTGLLHQLKAVLARHV
jgi:alpha/beta superfamily hydrolase